MGIKAGYKSIHRSGMIGMSISRRQFLGAAAATAASIAAPSAFSGENDNNVQKASYGNVKADYIKDCTSNGCAQTDATGWSDDPKNWDAVAVSVRMGTQSAMTDQEIKEYIAGGLNYYETQNYKFFFEQNDAPATGIAFHVRGGTSDLHTLDENLVPVIERYSRQANDPNFAKNDADEVAALTQNLN